MSLRSATPRPMLVTGALGGLGGRVASMLLDIARPVIGVDNFDPGSAPPPHAKYRLEMLRTRRIFRFEGADVRSLDLKTVSGDSPAPQTMIFCSQAIPARRGPTDPVLLRELALDVPLRFAGEIQEAGIDRLLVVQHLPFAENGDPREGDPLWRTMLDAEQELRNRLDRDAVRFILLPSLWGPGQSPRTAPLRQLWQIASRLPVEIPADDSPVLLAPLDAAANAVVSRAVAGDPPPERVFAPPLQSMSVTVHDLLEHFAEVAGIDPGELQGTLPPWGPPGETGPWDKERVNAHMAMLLEQAKHMPHFPPFDWAGELKREEKKQRSIRRKKRKARRENREDR